MWSLSWLHDIYSPYLAAVNSQGAGTQFSGPQHDLHHDLGLAIFLLVVLEALLWVVLSLSRAPFADASDH